MKSELVKIGSLIRVVNERNENLETVNLLGVNKGKEFMPSVANQTDLDLSKYKILRRNRFACNLMHVARDEVLPVALFRSSTPALVSPAYVTFEVREDVTLGPEYLMLMLRRAEFDRFAWFVSDSSVRGGLEWARFLEIKIPIAQDAAQRDSVVKLAANINALQASLTTSEIKLEHVLEACLSAQAKEHKLKPIGSLIEKCERRGSGLEKKHVRGISINKQFIKTKANLTNVDVSEYKVVAKDEFAYVTVTSRNGDKVSLAMNYGEDLIVSKTYEVFRVKPGVDLLPEYLMLWFRRPDFDRYARFHSWGSARETFDWPEMCRVEVPLPDLLAQSAVVKILRSLNQRRQSLQDLKNAQVKTARVLYSGLMAGGDLGSA